MKRPVTSDSRVDRVPARLARRTSSCYASGLAHISQAHRAGATPGTDATSLPDRFERETIEILKRLSRRPIQPTPDSELLADLGLDSLQVLELVGELEDHFNIAVPLNALTHIRTVAQVAGEVRRLAEGPRLAGEDAPA